MKQLKESRSEDAVADNASSERQAKKNSVPHLVNLNEDPMLSGVIIHFLDGG